jgi:hypothetical protein
MTGSAFIEEGNNNRLIHYTESPIFVFQEMKLRRSQFLHLCICERFIYQDRSQIHECGTLGDIIL